MSKKKRFFDRPIGSLVSFWEKRWELSLKPSQSRWQIILSLLTINLFFLAIFLSLYALNLLSYAVVFLSLGIIGFGFTYCLADYLRRRQKQDPIQTSIKTMKKEVTAELKNIGQLLEEYNKKLDKINEKIDKDKSKD